MHSLKACRATRDFVCGGTPLGIVRQGSNEELSATNCTVELYFVFGVNQHARNGFDVRLGNCGPSSRRDHHRHCWDHCLTQKPLAMKQSGLSETEAQRVTAGFLLYQ
jgi:hypothetical protein